MENLPSSILIEILSRLSNSTDLARCRLASRTLRFLSYEVQTLTLVCSRDRFLRSRAPATKNIVIPFRSLVFNLLSLLSRSGGGCSLRSLSLYVEEIDGFCAEGNDDDLGFDEEEDLHLSGVDFVSRWLPFVALGLNSLSIGDYWCQSCWRPSTALRLISEYCCNLLSLEMKNASLSIDGLKPMLNLINLKLEFIRLDDENLDKLNECFPFLQTLELIGVGGLRNPKIKLSQLKVCNWSVTNFPSSLAIHAPKLVELSLECVKPEYLYLETPLLSQIDLKIKKSVGQVKVGSFFHLKSVRIETSYLKIIKEMFKECESVSKLELEEFSSSKIDESLGKFTLLDVISAFPGVYNLKLGSGIWNHLESSGSCIFSEWRRNLKRLTIKLPPADLDMSLFSSVLNFCLPSCEVTVLIHKGFSDSAKNRIMESCICNFPIYRWKWEIWKESSVD